MIFCLMPLLGLKTVINLSHKPETDWQDRLEQWICERLRINYRTYPTIGFDEALGVVDWIYTYPSMSPVLVHCEGGRDRTGGVIALYKHLRGVSYEEIKKDWKIHFSPSAGWIAKIEEYIFDYHSRIHRPLLWV